MTKLLPVPAPSRAIIKYYSRTLRLAAMRSAFSFAFLAVAASFMIMPHAAEALSLSIGTISPNQTVTAGTNVSFQIQPSDYIKVTYVLRDSLPGSTLSNSDISTSGLFSWTPTMGDVGTHSVIITATDVNGIQSSFTQILYVRDASPVSLLNLTPGPSVKVGDAVSFSVSAAGFYNPSYSVSDSFSGNYGSTVTYSSVNSDGNFVWIPRASDVGVHNIAVRVTSLGRDETVYQSITVQGIGLTNISSTVVPVGSTLTFAATPYGIGTYPSYRVTDSTRNNTVDNMSISGNSFSWTPLSQDIGAHAITVTAFDGSGNPYTAILTVQVVSSSIASVAPAAGDSSGATSGAVLGTSTSASGGQYVFTKALQRGSTGTEVLELQKKLKAEGYLAATPNGVFGPQTEAAVKKYQKAKGIQQLGIVGPATRAALNR